MEHLRVESRMVEEKHPLHREQGVLGLHKRGLQGPSNVAGLAILPHVAQDYYPLVRSNRYSDREKS